MLLGVGNLYPHGNNLETRLCFPNDGDIVGVDTLVDRIRQNKRFENIEVHFRLDKYYLDLDYMGQPFGPMPALLAIADEVSKVHAICVRCGNLAHHSHRLTADSSQVLLGAQDSYEPICRHCFNELRTLEEKK